MSLPFDDPEWLLDHHVVLDWKQSSFQKLFPHLTGGRPVVVANGCFDLLHAGHIRLLDWCKEVMPGAFLLAALNSDDSVRRLKGPRRPYVSLPHRLYAAAALRSVNLALGFTEDTPTDLMAFVKPDLLVKGAEYAHREIVPGAEFARQVKFAPMELCDLSTTALEARIHEHVGAFVKNPSS